MKQWRKFILLILSIFLLSVSFNLVTAPALHAQIYPMFPFLYNPWSCGLPLLPAPIMAPLAPRIPLFAVPFPMSLSRSAAVVTTTVPITAAAPVVTILPPTTTPAGYTVTSLIPVLAPAPLLPITTTTTGALTAIALSGTSIYTLLAALLI